ncbi:MAG: putative DNA-binding domain-containing protein [Alphaproteobacteria bacterium]|nr:putative DNA-binding domain-containing protein [Alphaproteobacteria bacterium]
MSELARFQQAFVEALCGDFAPLAPWSSRSDGEARFSVYRNTAAKGLADALSAQFPTVARAVGEGWMRAAALAFAREHRPEAPALHAYGGDFPDWLAGFAPAGEMPWLSGLARIDWAVRDALFAADCAPLDTAAFAALSPDDFGDTCAALHRSATILWFDDGTAGLWRDLQADPPSAEAELAPEPGGLLVFRPRLEVSTRPLGYGAYAFLRACRAGESLGLAGQAALSAEPDLPLANLFGDFIAAGVFERIRRSPDAVW